ncbi:MAG: Gmad2 immunoglobulin-like domain-containing protein [Patescibacteria group bacterium]
MKYFPIALLAIVFFFFGAGCASSSTDTISDSSISPSVVLESRIVVDVPQPNDLVASPLEISGKARGPWYFEGSFVIDLVDVNGEDIGTGLATADGEWTTEDFVPFTSTMEFIAEPTADTGKLIFYKENPSGLPENDASFEVLVKFKE